MKTTFEQLALNLICDTVEADMAFGHHDGRRRRLLGRHRGRHLGAEKEEFVRCQSSSRKGSSIAGVTVKVSSSCWELQPGKGFDKLLKGGTLAARVCKRLSFVILKFRGPELWPSKGTVTIEYLAV